MNTATAKWHQSPYVAEIVAISQYAIKAILKIVIGGAIASSMIKGDGFHNLADIVPAAIVMFGIWIKRRKWKGYPFQLKEVESVLTLAIGALLGFTGFKIGWGSLLGCISLMPAVDTFIRNAIPLPVHEAVHINAKLLWPLVGLMGGSAIVSLVVARFQIHVGKVSGDAALTADGKETMTDGSVELVGLLGVILVQRFHIAAAEYILGFVVMGFVLHTAWEIFKPSLDAILKRSLGDDVEADLRTAALAVHGVEATGTLFTFRVGRTTAVCLMTVVTRLDANRHAFLRFALQRVIEKRLLEVEDAREVEIRIDFEEPPENPHRSVYACEVVDGRLRIVSDLDDATHVLICDLRQDDTGRSRFRSEILLTDPLEFAKERKVQTIVLHRPDPADPLPEGEADLTYEAATSSDPELELGVPLFPH